MEQLVELVLHSYWLVSLGRAALTGWAGLVLLVKLALHSYWLCGLVGLVLHCYWLGGSGVG